MCLAALEHLNLPLVPLRSIKAKGYLWECPTNPQPIGRAYTSPDKLNTWNRLPYTLPLPSQCTSVNSRHFKKTVFSNPATWRNPPPTLWRQGLGEWWQSCLYVHIQTLQLPLMGSLSHQNKPRPWHVAGIVRCFGLCTTLFSKAKQALVQKQLLQQSTRKNTLTIKRIKSGITMQLLRC